MSWDSYIERLMAPKVDPVSGVSTVFVKAAGIVSRADKSVWCRSELFNITQEEINKLVSPSADFQQNPPTFGGEGYMLLRNELDDEKLHNMQLKGKKGEKNNACVSRSSQTMVVVIGLETSMAADVTNRAYEIADYLIQNRY